LVFSYCPTPQKQKEEQTFTLHWLLRHFTQRRLCSATMQLFRKVQISEETEFQESFTVERMLSTSTAWCGKAKVESWKGKMDLACLWRSYFEVISVRNMLCCPLEL